MPAKPQRMFDVEFLLDAAIFDDPLVYLYRSGALRAAIKDCLKEIKGELGRALISCGAEELLGVLAGSSLLPGFNICDWIAGNQSPAGKLDGGTDAGVLASPDSGDCALFLPGKSPLTAHPNWPKVEAASLVLEEPLLSARCAACRLALSRGDH